MKKFICLSLIIAIFFIFPLPTVGAAEIPKEKLLSLAAKYLLKHHVPWEKAIEVRKQTKPCAVIFKDQPHDEMWPGCYVVTYFSSEAEIALKGTKQVLISLDATLVGFSPRE